MEDIANTNLLGSISSRIELLAKEAKTPRDTANRLPILKKYDKKFHVRESAAQLEFRTSTRPSSSLSVLWRDGERALAVG